MFKRISFCLGQLSLALFCCGLASCSKVEVVTIKERADSDNAAATANELATAETQLEEDLQEDQLYAAAAWIPEADLPWENWYEQYLDGQRIGYFHVKVSKGTSLFKVHKTTVLEMPDGDKSMRYKTVIDSFERPDGRLASFSEETTGPDSLKTVTGQMARNELGITVDDDGQSTSKKLTWQEGTWGVLGIQSILMSSPMQPEETRRAKLFITKSQTIELFDLVAGRKELSQLPGGDVIDLLPVVITNEGNVQDAFRSKVWVDEQGLIKKSVTMDAANIITFNIPTERGKMVADEFRLKSMLDVATQYEGALPDPHETVTYRAVGSKFSLLDCWSNNVRQSIKSISALTTDVTVHDLTDIDAMAQFESETPSANYLGSSPLIQPEDPRIASIIESFVDSADQPFQAVSKLARGVSVLVEETEFSESMLTSVEVARALEGDCSEHSVLLVTLLRHRGIPARVASGIRLDRDSRRFRYHMWVEAWLGDRWLPVDATTGEIADVDCIKMLDSDLASPNPYSVVLPVFEKMPWITIQLAAQS